MFRPLWVHSWQLWCHSGQFRATFDQFGPPLLATQGHVGPGWETFGHFAHSLGPFWSSLSHFGLLRATQHHSGHFESTLSTLISSGPFWSLWVTLLYFWSILAHSCTLWATLVHSRPLRAMLGHFGTLWVNSGPLWAPLVQSGSF